MKTSSKEFVENWIKTHEPDTFVRNGNGVMLYKLGASAINLEAFFEMLIEDFNTHIINTTTIGKWIYVENKVPKYNEEVIVCFNDSELKAYVALGIRTHTDINGDHYRIETNYIVDQRREPKVGADKLQVIKWMPKPKP